MKLAAVLIALLGLTAGAAALKCYTCSSVKAEIAGTNLGGLVNTLSGSLSCDDFNPSSPDHKFQKDCSALDKVCIRYVDSGDSKSQLRGCSVGVASKIGCEGSTCYCAEDLCNGAGPRGWPSAALLLLLPLAAILGAR